MKIVVLLFTLAMSACSSSDNSESNNLNALAGTWVSNCAITIDGIQNITQYFITTLIVVSDGSYSQDESYFEDAMCTKPIGGTFSYFGTFTTGASIQSADGSDVRVISITKQLQDSLDTLQYDGVYRITGMELNFGGYVSGRTPSLYYGLTYTKST